MDYSGHMPPNTAQGQPRQQKPKFNFQARNVKKEVTPDLMASQLASFGSSAKLKAISTPQSSQQTPQQQNLQFQQQQGFQMRPQMQGGFSQGFPQGFRQPTMSPGVSQGQFNMSSNFGMSQGAMPQNNQYAAFSAMSPAMPGMNSQPIMASAPGHFQQQAFSQPSSGSFTSQPSSGSFTSQPSSTFNQPNPAPFQAFPQQGARGASQITKQPLFSASGFTFSSNFAPVSSVQPAYSGGTSVSQNFNPVSAVGFDSFGSKPFEANFGSSSTSTPFEANFGPSSSVSQPKSADPFSAFSELSQPGPKPPSRTNSFNKSSQPEVGTASTVGSFGTSFQSSSGIAAPTTTPFTAFDDAFGAISQSSSTQVSASIPTQSSQPNVVRSRPGPAAASKPSNFGSSFNTPATATVTPKSSFDFNPPKPSPSALSAVPASTPSIPSRPTSRTSSITPGIANDTNKPPAPFGAFDDNFSPATTSQQGQSMFGAGLASATPASRPSSAGSRSSSVAVNPTPFTAVNPTPFDPFGTASSSTVVPPVADKYSVFSELAAESTHNEPVATSLFASEPVATSLFGSATPDSVQGFSLGTSHNSGAQIYAQGSTQHDLNAQGIAQFPSGMISQDMAAQGIAAFGSSQAKLSAFENSKPSSSQNLPPFGNNFTQPPTSVASLTNNFADFGLTSAPKEECIPAGFDPNFDFASYDPMAAQAQERAKHVSGTSGQQDFNQTNTFGDSFAAFGEIPSKTDSFQAITQQPEPFGEKSDFTPDFSAFSQIGNAKEPQDTLPPANVRGRPSAKPAASTVMLPPPNKAVERKRPFPSSLPKPPAPQATSQTIQTSASGNSLATQPFASSSFRDPAVDQFDSFPTMDLFAGEAPFIADFSSSKVAFSTETDGATFTKPKPARPTEAPSRPAVSMSRPPAPAPRPVTTASKRRAPPPPTSASRSTFYTEDKREIPSLLDFDFSAPAPSVSSAPAPLVILPLATSGKRGPPARPPPPSTGQGASLPIAPTGGPVPSLPPRPGPSHPLYHYMVKCNPHAVALFEFEAENHDELYLKAGETVRLEKDVDDDWFLGSVGASRGIFPKNMVQVKVPLPSQTPSTGAPATAAAPVITAPSSVDWGAAPTETPKGVTSGPSPDILDAWGTAPPSPPSSIEEEQEPAFSSIDWGSTAIVPDPTPPPVPAPEVVILGTCTVLYGFEGQEPEDLEVIEGDTVEIIDYVDDDWIKGRIGDKIGIFPRSYASFGDEEPESEQLEEIVDEATRRVNVFYDFEAGAEDELDLKAGEMVEVLGIVGDEWIKGRLNGKEGIFPSCFVPEIPSSWNLPDDSDAFADTAEGTEDWTTEGSSSDTSSSSGREDETSGSLADPAPVGTAQVIADFGAENDFELSVKKGDVVQVLAQLSESWIEAELSGKTGIIPTDFVTWLSRSDSLSVISNTLATGSRTDLTGLTAQAQAGTPHEVVSQQSDVGLGEFSDRNPFASGSATADPFKSDPFSAKDPFSQIDGDPFKSEGEKAQSGTEEVTWGGVGETKDDRDKTLTSPSENPFTGATENPFTSQISAGPAAEETVPKVGQRMKAVYTFEADNDDELSFEMDDIIEVLEYLNEDWLKGRCNGKDGLFPIAYAQFIS